MVNLLSPLSLGDLILKNRMVMAPMTRSRSKGNVPPDIAVTYYTQRASAGLIITEGAQVSTQGIGYVNTPGIHTEEQVAAWKKITDAVHKEGGLIFCQLWHVGRVSHPDFHKGELPVAPSALPVSSQVYTESGRKDIMTPRVLRLDEIPGVVDQFRHGATMARKAGFDGVEIHGANGYLIEQFLHTNSNHRTDAYGGSVQNRIRFAVEVAEAVQSQWPKGRVGFRMSPHGKEYGVGDANPGETYEALVKELDRLAFVYVHLIESVNTPEANRVAPALRKAFKGRLILNAGYTKDAGNAAIETGQADAISFARLFLANPDLPARFQNNAPLNTPDRSTFYTLGEKGYIDYPALPA